MKTRTMLTLLAFAVIAAPSANAAEVLMNGGFRLDPFRAYTISLPVNRDGAPITDFELIFEGVSYSSASVLTADEDRQYSPAPLTGLSVRLLDLDLNGDAWVEKRQRQVSDGFLVGEFINGLLVYKFDKELLEFMNQSQVSSLAMTITVEPDSSMEAYLLSMKSYNQAPIVPAPGAVLLVGIGTMTVGWLRRRQAI